MDDGSATRGVGLHQQLEFCRNFFRSTSPVDQVYSLRMNFIVQSRSSLSTKRSISGSTDQSTLAVKGPMAFSPQGHQG